MTTQSQSSASEYLEMVCQKLPVVKNILNRFGHMPLGVYAERLNTPPCPSVQSRDDIRQAVFGQICPVLGKDIATRAANDLMAAGTVMTTTHLGIDYFANSVQGNLIYGAGILTGRRKETTIPIFCFGNVPLNSSTFARGLLVYESQLRNSRELPLRLPIFPDNEKRTMTSLAKPFSIAMQQKALKKTNAWKKKNLISKTTAETIVSLLEHEYAIDAVLNQESYAAQAMIVNRMLGKRMLKTSEHPPDIVYLEIEKITAILLGKDLNDENSLAYRIFFNATLRNTIIQHLDGCPGCWHANTLKNRDTAPGKPDGTATGTIFFWGIDDYKRRVPLLLKSIKGDFYLCGRDDRGDSFTMNFNRNELIQALEKQKLLPSLFTCFLLICFARGFHCVGGVFQGAYLTWMKTCLADCLKVQGDTTNAEMIKEITTNLYQDGMLAFMSPGQNNELLPAGPIEIIQAGGINRDDLTKAFGLTVTQAHMAGLFGSLKDADAQITRQQSGWQHRVAQACSRELSGKIPLCKPCPIF
ncbi:hypothetical protein [Desulfobacter postgatei]|jgi:hypothetical protein|uniref:hypothetical protein n=1 Tax=Desulfobacter postgatei TaxID=2293 RepID=UPI002A36DE0C|nr:hypothetical protein [Desulfobacter postgatei]MDX9962839.1 hypothetical protein [Desulfobacter postgatei]